MVRTRVALSGISGRLSVFIRERNAGGTAETTRVSVSAAIPARGAITKASNDSSTSSKRTHELSASESAPVMNVRVSPG